MGKYNQITHIPLRERFFLLPNEIFSLGLTAGEIAVYAYLMYCEDRETYQCHPSYKAIGEALHISPNTIHKHIDRLRERRPITTETTKVHTKAGVKRNGNLLFTILPIENAMQIYFHEQMKRNDEILRKQQIEKRLR